MMGSRSRALVLLAIAATSIVATACGSFGTQLPPSSDSDPNSIDEPTTNTTPNASPDAGLPPTDAQSDAGVRTLHCGSSTNLCLGGGTEICCIKDASSSKSTCMTDPKQCTGTNATIVTCRIASDCGTGQVCCINKRSTGQPLSHCATSTCGTGELRLCKSDSECGSGNRCTDDKIEIETGLNDHYEVCRPKADASATTTAQPTQF
jgi:hypothetical protein